MPTSDNTPFWEKERQRVLDESPWAKAVRNTFVQATGLTGLIVTLGLTAMTMSTSFYGLFLTLLLVAACIECRIAHAVAGRHKATPKEQAAHRWAAEIRTQGAIVALLVVCQFVPVAIFLHYSAQP